MASIHLNMELKADCALPLFHQLAKFPPSLFAFAQSLLLHYLTCRKEESGLVDQRGSLNGGHRQFRDEGRSGEEGRGRLK